MDDVDAPVFYDDENDFVGYEYLEDAEYEYEYENVERETIPELYQYCLGPTIFDTASYMLPLLIVTCIFRVAAYSRKAFYPCIYTYIYAYVDTIYK